MKPNDRYRIPGEQVELQTRRHWSVLLGPIGLFAAVVLIAFLFSPAGQPTGFSTFLWWLTLPVLLWLLWKIADWAVDVVTVTDTRVFEISGLIVRKVAMMPLARITDLTYERSVLGMMLGYGELILETAGQDQALSNITHLPKPDLYYATVTRLTLPHKAPSNQLPPKEYWDELLDEIRNGNRTRRNGSR